MNSKKNLPCQCFGLLIRPVIGRAQYPIRHIVHELIPESYLLTERQYIALPHHGREQTTHLYLDPHHRGVPRGGVQTTHIAYEG